MRINLATDGFRANPDEDLYRKYIGGSGIGARFLYDLTDGIPTPGAGKPANIYDRSLCGNAGAHVRQAPGNSEVTATGIYGEGDAGGTWDRV